MFWSFFLISLVITFQIEISVGGKYMFCLFCFCLHKAPNTQCFLLTGKTVGSMLPVQCSMFLSMRLTGINMLILFRSCVCLLLIKVIQNASFRFIYFKRKSQIKQKEYILHLHITWRLSLVMH